MSFYGSANFLNFSRQSSLPGICPVGEDILPERVQAAQYRILPASVALRQKNCPGATSGTDWGTRPKFVALPGIFLVR